MSDFSINETGGEIMKKVMVFGTFDIIHPGHLHMFKEAKEYGDCLVAVVARDLTVAEVKKKPALNNENVRAENLKTVEEIDEIFLGHLDDKYQIIREVNPDVIALGYDQVVFIGNLTDATPENCQIVKLQPYMPEVYKSSILKKDV